jgi:hypothetical protein
LAGYISGCLVWFGLVGFSFNASLGPQRRARKRGRLAEAALAHHALWDKAEYPENSGPDPWAACASERRLITGLVWFGLVGFSFNASLGPQPSR